MMFPDEEVFANTFKTDSTARTCLEVRIDRASIRRQNTSFYSTTEYEFLFDDRIRVSAARRQGPMARAETETE